METLELTENTVNPGQPRTGLQDFENILLFFKPCFSGDNMETLELTENTVNPGQPRTGPQDFELLKLLGKGGYGKVGGLLFS